MNVYATLRPASAECPAYQVTLAPHLVMRGNLDFFLQPRVLELGSQGPGQFHNTSGELVDYFG